MFCLDGYNNLVYLIFNTLNHINVLLEGARPCSMRKGGRERQRETERETETQREREREREKKPRRECVLPLFKPSYLLRKNASFYGIADLLWLYDYQIGYIFMQIMHLVANAMKKPWRDLLASILLAVTMAERLGCKKFHSQKEQSFSVTKLASMQLHVIPLPFVQGLH